MLLALTALPKRLASRWQALPLAARLCLVIWIAIGTLGLVRFAAAIPSAVQAAGTGEYGQRVAIWAPAYGFAATCASRVAPGTSLLLLDPVDLNSGLRDHRLPYDPTNAGVFAYVFYPRPVTPLGAVPADWSPTAAGTDYIALWEQSVFHTSGIQTVAHATEQQLRQALPGQVACTYSDTQRGRGVLFAVSARARAALAASRAAPALGTPSLAAGRWGSLLGGVGTYLLALAGLASLWLIGLLALLAVPRGAVPARLAAVLAFPLGCLGVALELLLTALALPWLGLAALALWRHRALLLTPPVALRAARTRLSQVMRAPARWRLALDERLALGTLAAVGLVASLVAPRELPVLDGFGFDYFKALAFFHDRGVVPYYQHASALLFSAPAHPPLVSLCVAWLYLWLGQVNEHATLLLWPAFLVTLLASFYVLARSAVSRRLALWATVSLALVGFPGRISGNMYPWQMFDTVAMNTLVVGWADVPLAVFLLLGCGLLWRWAASERREAAPLLLAGLLLGGAALTKEEGVTAAGLALAASPLLVVWGRRGARVQPRSGDSWWRPLAWSAPGCAVSLLLWLLLRARYPIADFQVQMQPALVIKDLVLTIEGFGTRAIATYLAPLALIAVWVVQRRRECMPLASILSGRLLLLGCVVVGQATVDVASIASISVNAADVGSEMHTAAGRLLMHLLPLLLLGVLALWPDVLAAPGARPDPAATERERVPAPQLVAPSPTDGRLDSMRGPSGPGLAVSPPSVTPLPLSGADAPPVIGQREPHIVST